jgi:hypothetical protein
MARFALRPAGAGRLGSTTEFEGSHTPGPALRRRMTAAAGAAGGIPSKPLRAQIAPGNASGRRAAGALDAHISSCRAVRVLRALPTDVPNAEGKARTTGAVRVADTLNATAVLVIADLAGVAVDLIAARAAGARPHGVVHALLVGFGHAERARCRTVGAAGALDAALVDADRLGRRLPRPRAIEVGDTLEAEFGRAAEP